MIYCSSCGKKNSDEAKFCGKCGIELVKSKIDRNKVTDDQGLFSLYWSTFKKFAWAKGRASRKEYWTFFIFNFIVGFILGFIEALLETENIFSGLFNLIMLLPSIAVGVRRMHDIGNSGWWLLFPIVNFILLLCPSEKGENKHGSNPYNENKAK